jgi:hypothetical protein
MHFAFWKSMSVIDLTTKKCFLCCKIAGEHEALDGFCPTDVSGVYLFTKFTELLAQQSFKKLSKECPCGIFRADCEYHR